MSKSYLLGQIKELKERNALGKDLGMFTRFDDIDRILNEIEHKKLDNSEAIYQYIPLATVACIEGFFRFAVKTLIDNGTPFIEKVAELEKKLQLKISLDVVAEIQSKSLTLGDIVGHVLSCNKLDDIDGALTILLGKSFLQTIKTHSRPDGLIDEEQQKIFNEGHAQVFSDIKRIFELRHILAHEIASGYKLDKIEIIRCYNNTKSFIIQFIDLILYSIDPDKPRAILDNVAREQSRADQVDEELENILSIQLKTKPNLFMGGKAYKLTMQSTIDAWKSYRAARSSHAESTHWDAAAGKVSYLQCYIKTTRSFIEDLKKNDVLY